MAAINISTKTASDISALIDTRQFATAEEVIARAVDLLVQREHQIDHLRELIAIAEDQVARNDVIEMTPSFWDDLERAVETLTD